MIRHLVLHLNCLGSVLWSSCVVIFFDRPLLHADIPITHKESIHAVIYNSSFKQVITCSEGSVSSDAMLLWFCHFVTEVIVLWVNVLLSGVWICMHVLHNNAPHWNMTWTHNCANFRAALHWLFCIVVPSFHALCYDFVVCCSCLSWVLPL